MGGGPGLFVIFGRLKNKPRSRRPDFCSDTLVYVCGGATFEMLLLGKQVRFRFQVFRLVVDV